MNSGMSYGQFIAEHRKRSGFKSQAQFAQRTGLSKSSISRIEKETQIPNFKTLITMAKHLTTTSELELLKVCGYNSESIDEEYKKSSAANAQKIVETFDDMSDEELLKTFKFVHNGKNLTEKQAKFFLNYLRNGTQSLQDFD